MNTDEKVKCVVEIPIEKITVKEVSERAEVNRSTFYAYYKDVYDILEQAEEEIISALLSEQKWKSSDVLTMLSM